MAEGMDTFCTSMGAGACARVHAKSSCKGKQKWGGLICTGLCYCRHGSDKSGGGFPCSAAPRHTWISPDEKTLQVAVEEKTRTSECRTVTMIGLVRCVLPDWVRERG